MTNFTSHHHLHIRTTQHKTGDGSKRVQYNTPRHPGTAVLMPVAREEDMPSFQAQVLAGSVSRQHSRVHKRNTSYSFLLL